MAATLHSIHKRAIFHYPTSDRVEWLKQYPGMVVNTGAQIWWTYEVMDVQELKYDDETFDVAIDKSTMDCIFCCNMNRVYLNIC